MVVKITKLDLLTKNTCELKNVAKAVKKVSNQNHGNKEVSAVKITQLDLLSKIARSKNKVHVVNSKKSVNFARDKNMVVKIIEIN